MDSLTAMKLFGLAEFSADRPASDLSKSLGISQAAVARGLRRMMDQRDVTFALRRNPWRMGLQNYSVFFEFRASEESLQALERFIEGHSSVEYYGKAIGCYDSVAVVYAESLSELMAFLRTLEQKLPKAIERVTILTRMAVALFPHRQLLDKGTKVAPLFYSVEQYNREVDEVDRKIIACLRGSTEYNLRECSRKSRIPLSTLSRRIANLREKGVILAFTLIPAARFTGLTSHRLLISTSHTDDALRKDLLKLSEQETTITALISTVGSWNYEIEVACQNPAEVRKLLLHLKEKLRGAIQAIEHLEFIE